MPTQDINAIVDYNVESRFVPTKEPEEQDKKKKKKKHRKERRKMNKKVNQNQR